MSEDIREIEKLHGLLSAAGIEHEYQPFEASNGNTFHGIACPKVGVGISKYNACVEQIGGGLSGTMWLFDGYGCDIGHYMTAEQAFEIIRKGMQQDSEGL